MCLILKTKNQLIILLKLGLVFKNIGTRGKKTNKPIDEFNLK